MWIRVALDKAAIHEGSSPEYTYISGDNILEYYFDEIVAKALEKDGFLQEMWSKFDALFDWGDCDYFPSEKCQKFKIWLSNRLNKDVPIEIRKTYKEMLKFANLAIMHETGISFDF